ncbi:MAG: hypothetical protein KC940_17035, partial [Candidatus Omnitrophica bacterium]|nr:hypothetical protein [Candidatus Omnitrophota bacterium]
MKHLALVLCMAVVASLSAVPAGATLIVDTGQPPPSFSGGTLYSGQWLAAEFTLSQEYSITGVEGWMWKNFSGLMTLAIYTDGGSTPGTELFSTVFTADLPMTGSANAGWVGAHGLNWALGPGTYWAAFEVRTGQTADFAMPNSPPNPLSGYAWKGSGSWNQQFSTTGWRVYSEVPEPTTMALLG